MELGSSSSSYYLYEQGFVSEPLTISFASVEDGSDSVSYSAFIPHMDVLIANYSII